MQSSQLKELATMVTNESVVHRLADSLSAVATELPEPTLLSSLAGLLGDSEPAVRLTSAWLAAHPDRLAPELLQLMIGSAARFAGLPFRDPGDHHSGIDHALVLAYGGMDDEGQRRFRALGAFAPSAPVSTAAAAAIWGDNDADRGQYYLAKLEGLALISRDEATRYYLDPALAGYAYGLLRSSTEWAEGQDDEWLTATARHMNHFAEVARRLIDPENAQEFAADLANLDLACRYAMEHDAPEVLHQIVWYSEGQLEALGLHDKHELWLRTALEKMQGASANGDAARRQAQLAGALADTLTRRGAVDEAEQLLKSARDGFLVAGDAHSLGISAARLAEMAVARGETHEAESLLHEAEDAFRRAGDPGAAAQMSATLRAINAQSANLPPPEADTSSSAAAADSAAPDVEAMLSELERRSQTEYLEDEEITHIMTAIALSQQQNSLGVDWSGGMMASNPAPFSEDEIEMELQTALAEATDDEHQGVPGEFIELRLPPILDAYRSGGEEAVRKHVRELGMSESVVRQVIADLPMLLSGDDGGEAATS